MYALYGAGRWIAKADAATALQHTEWLVSVERGLGVFVEGSIQQALAGGVSLWLLDDHVYLGSELVVLPLVLVWLYPSRLRAAVSIFALFPVAPPRLADLGIADTVSNRFVADAIAGLALTVLGWSIATSARCAKAIPHGTGLPCRAPPL